MAAVSRSVSEEARETIRALKAHGRPRGSFDPSRYFRTTEHLEFLNVPTPLVRALGKAVANRNRLDWQVRDAQAFADLLMRQPYLEVKGAGIETLACFRRAFMPSLLAGWKRWLATNCAANWATTDSICGSLISPLLHSYPGQVALVRGWATHRNMWVRRAAAVSLVRVAARGRSLDEAYDVATTLRPDTADLIHKAAGWLLREAGRTDPARLERYLLAHGPAIPRTTVRYAIEHFSPDRREALLAATKASASCIVKPAGV